MFSRIGLYCVVINGLDKGKPTRGSSLQIREIGSDLGLATLIGFVQKSEVAKKVLGLGSSLSRIRIRGLRLGSTG